MHTSSVVFPFYDSAKTRIVFSCSISNWNRLTQLIMLGRSVGTFKAAVSSIMYICQGCCLLYHVHMLGVLSPLSCTYVGLLSTLSCTFVRGIVSSIMYICQGYFLLYHVHNLGVFSPLSCTYVRGIILYHVHMLGVLSPLLCTYVRAVVSSIMSPLSSSFLHPEGNLAIILPHRS